MGLDAEVLQARLSEAGRAGQPDVVREIAKNEFDLQVQKKLKSLCGGGVPSSLPWVVCFLSFFLCTIDTTDKAQTTASLEAIVLDQRNPENPSLDALGTCAAKPIHWKGATGAAKFIHTSRDYLCFRKFFQSTYIREISLFSQKYVHY